MVSLRNLLFTAGPARTLLRGIKGLSGELSQKAYLASWMGYFGTEAIHSLFERFSLWSVRLNSQSHQYVVKSGWWLGVDWEIGHVTGKGDNWGS